MVARRIGLQGLAITDHNAIAGVREAQEAAGTGFLVIPGTEVSTRDGHILAYGVRETIPRDLSVQETVERITALGGIAVAAHPYRFWSGLGEEGIRQARFSAFETCNGRTLRRGNERAKAKAIVALVGQTGGSDSHFLDEIARAVTSFNSGVTSVDDALQILGQGRTSAQGFNRGTLGTMRYVPKAVSEWAMRGFRRI
jgi:predicted metal-dependent phosphoesterase TrpH